MVIGVVMVTDKLIRFEGQGSRVKIATTSGVCVTYCGGQIDAWVLKYHLVADEIVVLVAATDYFS